MNKIKIILSVFLILSLSAKADGDGVNTMSSINGFLIDLNYSIAPVSSLAPQPTPLSFMGGGISMVSNQTLKIGFSGNMTIPTSNRTIGYTLDSDTIDIEYDSWDLKMSVAYLIRLESINSHIAPSLALGYGRANVERVDYYLEERKSYLEHSNLILVEPALSFNYVVDQSFILSLGVSYQVAVPDRLMINYSSSELNVLKVNVGLAFGVMQGNGGSRRGRRR